MDSRIKPNRRSELANEINSSPVFTKIPLEIRRKWYVDGRMNYTGYEKPVLKLINRIVEYINYEKITQENGVEQIKSNEKISSIVLTQVLGNTISNYDINNESNAKYLTYFLNSFNPANTAAMKQEQDSNKNSGIKISKERRILIGKINKYAESMDISIKNPSDNDIECIADILNESPEKIKKCIYAASLTNSVMSFETPVKDSDGNEVQLYEKTPDIKAESIQSMVEKDSDETVKILVRLAQLIDMINRAGEKYYMSLFYSNTIIIFLREVVDDEKTFKSAQQAEDECWSSMDREYVNGLFIQLTETFLQIVSNTPVGEINQNCIVAYSDTSRANVSQQKNKFKKLWMAAKETEL